MKESGLKSILEGHEAWSRGEGGSRADLRGANLREANLSRADLRGANLRGANLSEANLREANLSEAALSGANLRWANLRGADLRWANLRGADLRWANLSETNLSGANLSGANLSGANLLCPMQWLADNLERTADGWIAYKTFGEIRTKPAHWTLEPGAEIRETVNPNRTDLCGCGINVATLDWVRANMLGDIWRVLIPFEAGPSIVVPYNTDGKIRVGMVRLVERVE